jgi:3-dehydroquinate synthase
MTVQHRLGSYEIIFTSITEAIAAAPPAAFYITDENLYRAYGPQLEGKQVLVLPAGEGTKRMSSFERALEWLANAGAVRSSTIVAFGGGVIGDLAGFVAASYMRGIRYLQIPTSLLAQVDSSVGGKVGIDLEAGKNLAGAFYPPHAVHISIELLDSLPSRHFANGMSEVLKYGFIADPAFLQFLGELPERPKGKDLETMIRRCVEIKAEIVAEDEFEMTDTRAALNFGHTVGHAIEQVTHYAGPLHGEAIAIGMVAEATLGERLGVTEPGTAEIVRERLSVQGLPVTIDQSIDFADLMKAMLRDKKRRGDGLAFSLLTHLGECKLHRGILSDEVMQALMAL